MYVYDNTFLLKVILVSKSFKTLSDSLAGTDLKLTAHQPTASPANAQSLNVVLLKMYQMQWLEAGPDLKHVEAPRQPSVVELWRPTLP